MPDFVWPLNSAQSAVHAAHSIIKTVHAVLINHQSIKMHLYSTMLQANQRLWFEYNVYYRLEIIVMLGYLDLTKIYQNSFSVNGARVSSTNLDITTSSSVHELAHKFTNLLNSAEYLPKVKLGHY